jgi:hypothetical protein
MHELTPVFIISFIVALVYAYYEFRQVGALRSELRRAEEAREEKRLEAENSRADLKEKREELERSKKDLQEARNKLKKQDKAREERSASKQEKPATAESPSPSSAASTVHIIENQELEESHRKIREGLEAELAVIKREVQALRAKEAERQAALEKAQAQLRVPAESAAPAAPVASRRPEEELESLKMQLEALSRAAMDKELDLKKQFNRASTDLRSAERRAQSNHQLYQVAKGQLAVTEEKLAVLRRKYEGARAPEELKKPKAEEAPPEAPPATEAQTAPTAAPDAAASPEPSAPESEPKAEAVAEAPAAS